MNLSTINEDTDLVTQFDSSGCTIEVDEDSMRVVNNYGSAICEVRRSPESEDSPAHYGNYIYSVAWTDKKLTVIHISGTTLEWRKINDN